MKHNIASTIAADTTTPNNEMSLTNNHAAATPITAPTDTIPKPRENHLKNIFMSNIVKFGITVNGAVVEKRNSGYFLTGNLYYTICHTVLR